MPRQTSLLWGKLGNATYTSTGVNAPCVIPQHIAPANAKRAYRSTPLSFGGALGFVAATTTSTADDAIASLLGSFFLIRFVGGKREK